MIGDNAGEVEANVGTALVDTGHPAAEIPSREVSGFSGQKDPGAGRNGFTLIEVVAVIVIIAVIAAFALSRINFRTDLQAEVDKMKSQLRYVQHVALCGNNTYTWRMNITANSYTFTRWDGVNSVGMPLPGATGTVNNTVNLPTGITVTAGTGTISFDQWGSPGANTIAIDMTDGSTTRGITVTKNTGFVP
jgi:prepilin-type N-terminal cleavage/methylation domain-containing protein